jgi:glycosyltransferase involved in cell wall biosynthesis
MTKLGLVPYPSGDGPAPRSVPVSVVVLAKNEAANIRQCLASLTWADQVVVIDSGSTDDTADIARSMGADVVDEPWRGFSNQRQFALGLSALRHDWLFLVDADEWVSSALAVEVAEKVATAQDTSAFSLRLRLVFEGRWIRHCGWYSGSWTVRVMRRSRARYQVDDWIGRPLIEGRVERLANDIVDEDRKGLAAWLHKHVDYAVLEAERRGRSRSLREVLLSWPEQRRGDTRPISRAVLKDLVFPAVPAKPLAVFFYMYVVRLGFLDGAVGLRFCVFHAWFQVTVGGLRERQDP